jgi:hypothetical protein
VGVMRAGELVLELGTRGLDPRALEHAYLAAVFGGAASEGVNSGVNPITKPGASGAPA